jgi:hypothetical protein
MESAGFFVSPGGGAGFNATAMKVDGLRSPYDKRVGGLHHLGRMVDKIRLRQLGRLPDAYHRNYGLSVGLDGHLCGFLGIEFAAVEERVKQGGADEEIAEWIFQRSLRPNRTQVRIWNEFSRKFGWNDALSRYLARTKQDDGLNAYTEVVTAFDLIDLDEGRGRAGPGPEAALE